jgi:hypothetical protein
MSKPDGPSIKDVLSGKMDKSDIAVKEQHEIYLNNHLNENFTEELFAEKWNLFLSKLESPNQKTTLSPAPEFNPDYRFILRVENTVQEEIIRTIKPELVAFLRKELKNSSIEVIAEIREKEGIKFIYSDDEKYQEMAKKNPDLILLRQKFKLDFGD